MAFPVVLAWKNQMFLSNSYSLEMYSLRCLGLLAKNILAKRRALNSGCDPDRIFSFQRKEITEWNDLHVVQIGVQTQGANWSSYVNSFSPKNS